MSLRIEASIRVTDLSGGFVIVEATEAKVVMHRQDDDIGHEMMRVAPELHQLVERVQASKDTQLADLLNLADGGTQP